MIMVVTMKMTTIMRMRMKVKIHVMMKTTTNMRINMTMGTKMSMTMATMTMTMTTTTMIALLFSGTALIRYSSILSAHKSGQKATRQYTTANTTIEPQNKIMGRYSRNIYIYVVRL